MRVIEPAVIYMSKAAKKIQEQCVKSYKLTIKIPE